ncbi:MAG TPA: hypothetical protein VEQ41_08590 [Solirubrobacterales bacterium]|nr:hypothetical protein [Solirubrobacterales bacterium]
MAGEAFARRHVPRLALGPSALVVLIFLFVAAPLQAASPATTVADCDYVQHGSGAADWRSRSTAAGPLGFLRGSLQRMTETRNGQLVTKMPATVEGHRTVTLSVPRSLQHRVFLYYGREGARGARRGPGFSEVVFEPCEEKPRTVWPGGIRVKGRKAVRLTVRVEGRPDAIPLRLGRPRPFK